MADLKSLWCYNIGDNVVYGISWVSDLSCWSLKLEETFIYSKEVINFWNESWSNLRHVVFKYGLAWNFCEVFSFFTSGKASRSEFTYKTGDISSDVIAGFTLGYHWFLIFEHKKRRGSLPFQIYT